MKIAIDINDVIRDYSNNFVKYYLEGYNHTFNLDEFELCTNELKLILPFASDRAYQKFIYEDYSYELYAKCPVCTRGLESELTNFIDKTVKDIDSDEEIEVMLVSPLEYSASIGNTYMFIAKLGLHIREVYLPVDSATIWDKCDVLITANPFLLKCKPDNKVAIKIKADYNKDVECEYTYPTLSSFITKEENLEKIISEVNK